MIVNGELKQALLEQLASDPVGTGLVAGRLWYNTTDSIFRVYDGSTVQEFVDLSAAQTLANKVLESANISNFLEFDDQGSTPATPAAGKKRLYVGADDKFYFVDENGDISQVGAGGSSSGTNYLQDAMKDEGWTDDTNLSIAENITAPIIGVKDLKVSKTAVDASGQSVKYPFTISSNHQARLLPISLEIKTDSVIADGDFRIRIYDVTNAKYIDVLGEDIYANELGYLAVAYVQFSPDSTSYRFELEAVTTSTTAMEFQIADLFIGVKAGISSGPFVSGNKTQVLSIKGTTSDPTKGTIVSDQMVWRRSAGFIEGFIAYEQSSAGTAGAGDYYLELPPGVVIDTDKAVNGQVFGSGKFSDHSDGYSADSLAMLVVYDTAVNANGLALKIPQISTSNLQSNLLPVGSAAYSSLANTNLSFYAYFKLPVAGWDTGVSPAEIGSNRDVFAEGASNGGGAITANTTDIDFTQVSDNTDSFNGTVFTAPETGRYQFQGLVRFTAANSGIIGAFIDGVIAKGVSSNASLTVKSFGGFVDLVKGEELSFRSDVGGTLSPDADEHVLSIQKVPSVLAHISPSEKIHVEYRIATTKALTAGNTVLFDQKIQNSHNAYNPSTGEFTVPRSGLYHFDVLLSSASTTAWTTGSSFPLDLVINGSLDTRRLTRVDTAITNIKTVSLSKTKYLNEGDVVTFEVAGTGGPTPNTINNGNFNYLTIVSM